MQQHNTRHTLHLRVLSKTEELSGVREFISTAARGFGFDEETINKIALAVDEACTNIIKHAYVYAADKVIDIEVLMNLADFEVVITHCGRSFDPETIRPPDMSEYFSHYRRGGLGMHLMRSLMDKVEYRNLPGKKSEVHLLKRMAAGVKK